MTDPRHAQQHDLGEYVQEDNAETLAGPLDDDPLDSGWVPPDRQAAHARDPEAVESLAERLDDEEPEEDADEDRGGDPELAYTPLPEAQEYAEEVDAELGVTEGGLDLDEREFGGRAGRLVAPDEGAHGDEESEAIGQDVGIDGGAASAEEAAIHLEPER